MLLSDTRENSPEMIIARNISKSFGNLEVLNGLNLQIKKGSIYGLAGRSGVGKSTLLRCINGLEPYDTGHLIVDGVDVKQLSDKELRVFRKNIGMIFQNFSLLERLTVYDNVALPLRCWKLKPSHIEKQTIKLLELVGLSEKIGQKPRALSGGQKQRVAIARALSLEPRILLCDEATSALDPKTSQEIISLLHDINNRLGITIVMVTHQMSILSSACDEVAIIENGRVDIHGPVRHIFREQPLALKNLLGVKPVVPGNDSRTLSIRLLAGAELAGRMASELGMELTIVGEKARSGYQNPCDPILRFSENNYPEVAKYLDTRKAAWQIIGDPEPVLKCVAK